MIKGSSMACYKVLHMEKPNIDDVIRINAIARGGEIVENKDEADIVFAFNNDNEKQITISPSDLDYFSGNLMPNTVSDVYKENGPKLINEKQIDNKTEDKNNEIYNENR